MADENTMLRGCRTTCTPLPEDPVPPVWPTCRFSSGAKPTSRRARSMTAHCSRF